MIRKLYLDLDGTLANWMKKAFETFDINAPTLEQIQERDTWKAIKLESEDVFWKEIEKYGDKWWETIEPFDYTKELYNLCKSLAPTCILSKTGPNPSAGAGKIKWIYKNLGKDVSNFLLGRTKIFNAYPDALLIDDYDKNCEKFIENGGNAFVWPQPYNTNSHLTPKQAMKQIVRMVKELENARIS